MPSFRHVSIDRVPPGTILSEPLMDLWNPRIKLLSEGMEVTAAFLEKLRKRGIREIVIGTRDLARIESFRPQGRIKAVPPAPHYVQSSRTNEHTQPIDQLIRNGQSLKLGEISEPVLLSIHRPMDCSYDNDLQHQWASEHDGQVETLGKVFDATCSGEPGSINVLRQQCETILSRLEEDCDAMVCLAGSPYSSEYPSRHAVHLAGMAMAMGIEMGLDYPHLMDLGIGCLIHDVGMQKIGLEWFHSKSAISTSALKRLADHPVHALEIADDFGDQLSNASKMVVYQIHERLDGSGYPRGCTVDQIHRLAKIAAVADEFVALVAPRPHRLGVQGYYAIKQILDDTKAGKFDPGSVRALLQTTGLFPIGSYVALTNNQIGRVIRTGGDQFDKPTIEMWQPDHLESKPSVVNLREDRSIQISSSIPLPKSA